MIAAINYENLRSWDLTSGNLLQVGNLNGLTITNVVFMPELDTIVTLINGDLNMYISNYTTLQYIQALAVKHNAASSYSVWSNLAYRPGSDIVVFHDQFAEGLKIFNFT